MTSPWQKAPSTSTTVSCFDQNWLPILTATMVHMNKHIKLYKIASSYGVEVVATVPATSKPSIDTKSDDDVILLSREDVEIDDVKAKTPPTIFLNAILPARTRQPATMMTTWPMGTVNQVPVLKAKLQAIQQWTIVKVAFLRCQPATRTLSFKIFFAN